MRKGIGRMRHALRFICAVVMSYTLVSGVVLGASTRESSGDWSIYAPRILLNGSASLDDNQLLPVKGSDLPLPTVVGNLSSGPQDSIVEAIPTPTAFHAGAVLLLALVSIRFIRKLRLV